MSRPSWKIVLTLSSCALLAGSLTVAVAAASAPSQVRLGVVPKRPSGASVVGALSAGTTMRVTVALKPRDLSALDSYATAVSTPGSSVYHQYLSVAGFRQRFAPTAAQIAAVVASLRAHGLNPGTVSANGLAIPIRSTAGAIAHAFATSFQRLSVPGKQTAFANTEAPLLDASVAGYVQDVIGLNNLSAPRPVALRSAHSRAQATRHVLTGGPQPCPTAVSAAAAHHTYTTDQIASAYRFSNLYAAGNQGAGETIAVYELEGNFPSDISAYGACYGINPSVSYAEVDGGPPAPDASIGDGVETDLDVQSAIGLAPKANVIVYQGPNSNSSTPGSGPFDTYNAIVSDDKANVISTSWAECEVQEGSVALLDESTLFAEAAVQGQTVVAAAGDDGSDGCTDANGNPLPGLAVDDPASQPFVTGVGGTTMPHIGPPPSEAVWNDLCNKIPCAGGGGVSGFWGMPSYQADASASLKVINSSSSSAACGAPSGTYCREVPDVSADSDPATGATVYWDGDGAPTDGTAWIQVGGTSAAAPLWAALFVLADSSSSCKGKPIGFANPALYRAASAEYTTDFNDITSGTNALPGSGTTLYPAGSGYDMASGLGSPDAASLPAALCGLTVRVANVGTQRTVLRVPTHLALKATDAPGQTLDFLATGLPRGLSINSKTGVISGRPTRIGASSVTVYAIDNDGSLGSATFTWGVGGITVRIRRPGTQRDRVGKAVRLRIHARDNNRRKLRYSASRLPRGLSINHSTGLISGRPSRPGSWLVTVTAQDGSTSAHVRFRWKIKRT